MAPLRCVENLMLGRGVLAGGMIAMGLAHLIVPAPFVRVMPEYLPSPALLVLVSGFAEIAGGTGLLVPRTRKAAGWGLVLLFVAVFPANVDMALHPPPEFPFGFYGCGCHFRFR